MSESSQIVTYSGRVFDPLNPDPEGIEPVDIAHALANQCRFTGHTTEFYSVAQHCVLGSFLMPSPKTALIFLLHDASEAYISDIARPVKRSLSGLAETYAEIEEVLNRAVSDRFNLPWPWPKIVHVVDDQMLMAEQRQLMPDVPELRYVSSHTPLMYAGTITPWGPTEAEQKFYERYRHLTGGAQAG